MIYIDKETKELVTSKALQDWLIEKHKDSEKRFPVLFGYVCPACKLPIHCCVEASERAKIVDPMVQSSSRKFRVEEASIPGSKKKAISLIETGHYSTLLYGYNDCTMKDFAFSVSPKDPDVRICKMFLDLLSRIHGLTGDEKSLAYQAVEKSEQARAYLINFINENQHIAIVNEITGKLGPGILMSRSAIGFYKKEEIYQYLKTIDQQLKKEQEQQKDVSIHSV